MHDFVNRTVVSVPQCKASLCFSLYSGFPVIIKVFLFPTLFPRCTNDGKNLNLTRSPFTMVLQVDDNFKTISPPSPFYIILI